MLASGTRPLASDSATANAALDPGYQHSQRLQVAVARAAADALGMSTDATGAYRADYRLQQTQIQADSEGLDRWAAHDAHRQGLLLEIRASLAGLRLALDQATGTPTAAAIPVHVPLLPALTRAETALSNYGASVLHSPPGQGTHAAPGIHLLVWVLRMLFIAELAALAWLFFSKGTP